MYRNELSTYDLRKKDCRETSPWCFPAVFLLLRGKLQPGKCPSVYKKSNSYKNSRNFDETTGFPLTISHQNYIVGDNSAEL